MTSRFARWAGLFACAAGLLALADIRLNPTRAAQPGQPGTDPLIPKDKSEVSTAFTACKRCHNHENPASAAKDEYALDYKSNEFVLLSEGRTWKQEDPHSAASKVLEGELGQQMSRLLKYDVTKAASCLTCHAVDMTPAEHDLAKKEFDSFDGVTCNACHGLRKPWQTNHWDQTGALGGKKRLLWRVAAPADKEKAGMRDLRDPVVKAKLCVSCHVGSPSEGRVVTHDMYAAGHPPLPPFELASFMECEPKHWGYPTNPTLKFFTDPEFVAYAGKDFADKHPNWRWELYRFHPAEDEMYLARQLVTGAIASLRAEMECLAHSVKQVNTEGIDYARFDCYACHHDLQYPSPRQQRGFEGKPGRPPLKAWVGALPGVVAKHATTLPPLAGVAGSYAAKWQAVQSAALAKPFGDPTELPKAATDMIAWCDAFLKATEADGKPLYSKQASQELLDAIAAAAVSSKWTADAEAAMHLTWATITLREHMNGPLPQDKLDQLGKTIPAKVRFPPYSKKEGEFLVPRPSGEQIGPRLERFHQYQPKPFVDAFQQLLGKGG